MKKVTIAAFCAAILTLSACEKATDQPRTDAANATPAPNSAPTTPVPAPAPVQPPHNYQMVDQGTYGYEPALSEDDIRKGIATKPLIMVRYEGNRNGTYIILILGVDQNNSSVVNRVSCQLPCQYAKSEMLLDASVISTETLPVRRDSIMGAMLEDAVSGQLAPYGQRQHDSHIEMQPQPAVSSPLSAASSSVQMWVGAHDTNLRSCPGVGCTPMIVIPKGSGVSVDMSSAQTVPQSTDSWVRATYSGPYCSPESIDPQLGCVAPVQSSNPVSGWLNFSLLSQSPRPASNATPAVSASDQSATTYQTSFDCAKATSVPDYLICHDPDLAMSDRELATIYQQAKAAVTDKAAFTDRTRKQWNYREKNCRDKSCLAAWYADQKIVLTKIAQTGDVNAQ